VSSPFEFPEAGAKRRIEPEPWYYGFLSGYAKMWMFFAILATLAVVVPAIISYVVFMFQSSDLPDYVRIAATVGTFTWVVAAVFVLIFVLFFIALILLAVDAGRNLRKIRENTRG
jgi:phosphotransferase system  glucose/maltose/N-acetylglucosamine-specific IIC component